MEYSLREIQSHLFNIKSNDVDHGELKMHMAMAHQLEQNVDLAAVGAFLRAYFEGGTTDGIDGHIAVIEAATLSPTTLADAIFQSACGAYAARKLAISAASAAPHEKPSGSFEERARGWMVYPLVDGSALEFDKNGTFCVA